MDDYPYSIDNTQWFQDAACFDVADPDIFFPPRDKERYKAIAAEAKTFCFGSSEQPPCPVRVKCLWHAIATDEQHGIWGGMSHRERNALVRKWQREFKNKMPLKDFVMQHKEKENGSSN
jgi:WhiB family redox-sensing transcriptional regulator